ncbi:putative sulfite reductase [NADPH] flavoprotein component [Zancudomyces culisetae]|uniref:assimilatory sulfite reductase (NADPH) n=1 Tax=Zancudomyces culisetae TaxID=1213189 RepID=A0A1R1PCK4_ZANCU|nr:putative sulfite reductase [NADPH] flavoprotein component [Zancudomyces culisetae]|eukprot:OMH78683.1 putative sulfite reductase [NADPH] flavoprotein component [Zancudomyces culisetae]
MTEIIDSSAVGQDVGQDVAFVKEGVVREIELLREMGETVLQRKNISGDAEAFAHTGGIVDFLKGGNASAAELKVKCDANTAISHVCQTLSDVVLVYDTEELYDELSLYRPIIANTKNIWERVSVAVHMQTREGAGTIGLGIKSEDAQLSIIAYPESMNYFRYVLATHKNGFAGVVFNIFTTNEAGQTLNKFSQELARYSDAEYVVLTSETPQKAHDISIISFALASVLRIPVFHMHLSAAGEGSTNEENVMLSSSSLVKQFTELFSAKTKEQDLDKVKLMDLAYTLFDLTYHRLHKSIETHGSLSSSTVIISLGQFFGAKNASGISCLNDKDIAEIKDLLLISINDYTTSSVQRVAEIVDSGHVKRVLVVGSSEGGSFGAGNHLYRDLITTLYLTYNLADIDIEYKNVSGLEYGALKRVIYEYATQSTFENEDFAKNQESAEHEGSALVSVVASTCSVTDIGSIKNKSPFSSEKEELFKKIVFKDNYAYNSDALTGERVHFIRVKKKVRLTPESYDRNVFHIEFDTTGSGLEYEIGDALGVYGYNDVDEVEKFLEWYGVEDSQQVIAKEVNGKLVYRTIFQWFYQSVDLFGRPGKKFYNFLAEYATDSSEAEKLAWLTTSEGTNEFKKRVEDTTTYADLLFEFASAKPELSQLIDEIPLIKQRHYSISSSAKMHPNSVHLLVVSVHWDVLAQQQKKERHGLCTRYLDQLRVGDEIMVSIKPSAMKLPEDDKRPIVMAGLGTGMAPFKAFIEERSYRKSMGIEVGPIALYFGSRYRNMEYLYGEELEAYHSDQLLTVLRLAFSRDQKEKIYIQHRLQNDSEMLAEWLVRKKGSFYLCGPTWPAGDVKDAIVSSFVTQEGMTEKMANRTIDEMKNEERYVLEVY